VANEAEERQVRRWGRASSQLIGRETHTFRQQGPTVEVKPTRENLLLAAFPRRAISSDIRGGPGHPATVAVPDTVDKQEAPNVKGMDG